MAWRSLQFAREVQLWGLQKDVWGLLNLSTKAKVSEVIDLKRCREDLHLDWVLLQTRDTRRTDQGFNCIRSLWTSHWICSGNELPSSWLALSLGGSLCILAPDCSHGLIWTEGHIQVKLAWACKAWACFRETRTVPFEGDLQALCKPIWSYQIYRTNLTLRWTISQQNGSWLSFSLQSHLTSMYLFLNLIFYSISF
jgi:hypothetical protein